MRNVKYRYLCHDIAINQFCDQSVTGINSVASYIYVFSCYFEVDVVTNEKIDNYLKDIVAYIQV